jgi:serine/threonine protein kinase
MAHVNRDSIENDSGEELPSEPTLRDKLCNVRIEWPKGSFRYFIAVDELSRIVTPESISVELERCGVEFVSDEIRQECAVEISKVAPKLFSILVCLKRGHYIMEFLDERIDDTHLPFVRSDKTAKSGHFKLCSKRNPDQPIKCMATWDQARVNDFGRDQWCMLAPIFEYADEIKHYELHDNCVLPCVEDDELSDRTIQGGYGSVWKIAIHPAHQRVGGSAKQKVRQPVSGAGQETNGRQVVSRFVALKRLHSSDEQSFTSEVEMLKLLKKRKHAHVINLLATFRLKGRYYLLFPYADYNLRQYWQHTPLPDFSETTVSWILQQCKAIASALYMVHEYQDTREFSQTYATMHSSPSNTSEPQGEDEGRRYGRHGDIKAENILLFTEGVMDEHGLLVLADFGMTAFHKKASRSKVKAELVTGSPSYESPELMLHSSISRAYDIWSLGCFYLEFITWMVCGWEQLKRFPDARGRTGITTPEMNDDTFFTILEGEHRAIVRQGVQDWIKDLHTMPRCSAFIHEILKLISEQMLVVNPVDRISIGRLNATLGQMLESSRREPLYLIAPHPYSPRDQQPEPLSLAALKLTGDFRPPLPTEGTPLPRRSSFVSDTQGASDFQQQTESQIFVDISPPSSPGPGDPDD